MPTHQVCPLSEVVSLDLLIKPVPYWRLHHQIKHRQKKPSPSLIGCCITHTSHTHTHTHTSHHTSYLWRVHSYLPRVGQVISLPKEPYIHYICVLDNPIHTCFGGHFPRQAHSLGAPVRLRHKCTVSNTFNNRTSGSAYDMKGGTQTQWTCLSNIKLLEASNIWREAQ